MNQPFSVSVKNTSVYASEIKEMSSTNIARLLSDPPKDKVASKPPVKCQENKVFVIDKKTRLVFKTQRTGKQIEMMEVMLLL